MSSRLKVFVQYIVILSLTAFLVWFSLKGLRDANQGTHSSSWDYLLDAWGAADKRWLMAMAVVAILSHLIRALRWRMLMVPSGIHSKVSHSFYSLMVGYLVNLVIPRGGEVSRCYNLYKLDGTPVELSFGTVVTERIIDVLFLLSLIAFSFIMESTKLFAFIDTLPIGGNDGKSKLWLIAGIAAGGLILAAIAYLILRKNERFKNFFQKTIAGFKQGLLSVFKLKEKKLFIFYSILIWVLYFVMSYTVIRAFPSTSILGFNAVLSLFAIGAIAMAVPLPGGTGSYHVLVPQGLVFLYQVPEADAIAFTFIFHGWQTLIMILGGALSVLLTTVILRRKKPVIKH